LRLFFGLDPALQFRVHAGDQCKPNRIVARQRLKNLYFSLLCVPCVLLRLFFGLDPALQFRVHAGDKCKPNRITATQRLQDLYTSFFFTFLAFSCGYSSVRRRLDAPGIGPA
jgi:hypothetical protein